MKSKKNASEWDPIGCIFSFEDKSFISNDIFKR